MAISKISGAGLSSITAAELGTGSVDTDELVNDAVTAAKIDEDGAGFVFGDVTSTGALVGLSTLAVTGAVTASSTVGITGAVTASDTLAVTGTSALTGAVTLGTGGTSWALPTTRSGTKDYVLSASNTTGGTQWAETLLAPVVSAIDGDLNAYYDADGSTVSVEKGGTLYITGTGIGSTTVDLAIYVCDSVGASVIQATTVSNASGTTVRATWDGTESGYSTWSGTYYIKITKLGLTSNIFNTNKVITADPTLAVTGGTGATVSNLGSYGRTVTGGAEDSNTKLLLHFDRGGGTDIENAANIGGVGHKAIVAGNVKIKASPFGDGKSAMFFDGTDDELTVASSTDFDIVPGDTFTIELWLNRTTADGSQAYTRVIARDGAVDGWALTYDASGNILQFGHDSGGTILDSAYVTVVNRWYHVAIVGDGTNVKMYIDGVVKDSKAHGTLATWVAGGSLTGVTIGRRSDNTVEFGGYLDEIRIVNGTAVYTSNFTPPTTRLTEITNTKLLIHSNLSSGLPSSTFTDSATTGTTHTITPTGAFHSTLYNHAESTVVPPALAWPASGKTFGSTGAYFDGTLDNITFPLSTDWDFGTTDFTIDWWANVTNQTSNARFFTIGNTASGSTGIFVHEENATTIRVALPTPYFDATVTFNDNAWHHYAIVRQGTTLKFYFDGVYKSQTTSFPSDADYSGDVLTIGAGDAAGTFPFTGYIDEFRISNVARWTANFNNDLPTAIYGTSLAPVVPTITVTATVAEDENITFTDESTTTLTSRGLTFADVATSGSDKKKATIAGTITSAAGTYSNIRIKAAYTPVRTGTLNSTTSITAISTTNIEPGMTVTGTNVGSGRSVVAIATADATNGVLTLDAATTGSGSQTLTFLDAKRITELGELSGAPGVGNTSLTRGVSAEHILFNARRYMGNGIGLRHITGFGFQPDLVWFKNRPMTNSHEAFDSVRGVERRLYPNNTSIGEAATNGVTAFLSDGVQIGKYGTGHGNVGNGINEDTKGIICWGWKAGGAPSGELVGSGATMSGTSGAGTIHNSAQGVSNLTSLTQSVSQTSGFSITKFTGHASGGTFPHNLGGTPAFIIIKSMTEAQSWSVWHKDLNAGTTAGYRVLLDTIGVETSGAYYSTAPSSAIITCGSDDGNGGSGSHDFICYAWKAVAEVSAFGSYTGVSGGAKVTLDFRPRFIITKASTGTATAYTGWTIVDAFRSTGWGTSGTITLGSASLPPLYTNADKVEGERGGSTSASNTNIIIYDDGFRFNWDHQGEETNTAGRTYIYIAFA